MNSNCPDCNKVLRNPKRCSCGWTLSATKTDAPVNDGKCTAHGCPMPGSISHSVHGSHSWLCHMHFRASVSNWQKLTEKIRQHSMLVNLIKEIRMAQNGKPFDLRGWYSILENAGRLEYYAGKDDRSKSGRLSPRLWLSRLEKTLYGLVMAGMDEEEKSSGIASNAEKLMEHIEEFLKAHQLGTEEPA